MTNRQPGRVSLRDVRRQTKAVAALVAQHAEVHNERVVPLLGHLEARVSALEDGVARLEREAAPAGVWARVRWLVRGVSWG